MKKKRSVRFIAIFTVLVLMMSVSAAAFAAQDEIAEEETMVMFSDQDITINDVMDDIQPEDSTTVPESEEPTTEEPTTEEPTTEEPTTQEPTTEEPTTQKPEKHSHVFGSWKTARKATTKKDGLRVRTCNGCGKKQTLKIPRVKSAKLKYNQKVYNGKAFQPGVTVKAKDGKALKKGKDYTVRYQNNKRVGTATVILTGKGSYRFKITRSFRILPRPVSFTKLSPGSSNVTVQWKHVEAQASGYQVQIAADKAFTKNVITKNKLGGKATSLTVSGLKEKTEYFARIRTFKYVDQKYYCAAWSKVKTFKTTAASPHAIEGQLPQTPRVASTYFDDAVFVGDSVSLGLSYYEAANDVLGKAQFLTAGSLGSGNALGAVTDKSVHPRYNGQKMKVEKAVAACGAKKVYIMLGMNDIGAYGVDKSAANFKTLCKKIQAEAPGVQIFVESVTPRVNQGSKSDNVKLNNANITSYNKKLAAICQAEGWYFVNVAEFMFDSTGHLIRSYCSDPDGMGMHFSYDGCKAWVNYLYTHTA